MYGLGTFLSDPIISNIVIPLVLDSLVALSKYALKNVIQKIRNIPSDPNKITSYNSNDNSEKDDKFAKEQVFSGLIYPQVKDIVPRIDGVSGIQVIEFYHEVQYISPLQFDIGTKDYVKQMEDEYFLVGLITIEGTLRSLHLQNFLIIIRRATNDFVKAYLNEADFERVRYEARESSIITLTGRPRYKFGIETQEISEFEAYSLKLEKSDK